MLEIVLPERGKAVTLVALAAILVATIRIHALGEALDLRVRGSHQIPCDATFEKGAELGWFENGSTILVFASPGLELRHGIMEGTIERVGLPLLRRPYARAENVERTEEPRVAPRVPPSPSNRTPRRLRPGPDARSSRRAVTYAARTTAAS